MLKEHKKTHHTLRPPMRRNPPSVRPVAATATATIGARLAATHRRHRLPRVTPDSCLALSVMWLRRSSTLLRAARTPVGVRHASVALARPRGVQQACPALAVGLFQQRRGLAAGERASVGMQRLPASPRSSPGLPGGVS